MSWRPATENSAKAPCCITFAPHISSILDENAFIEAPLPPPTSVVTEKPLRVALSPRSVVRNVMKVRGAGVKPSRKTFQDISMLDKQIEETLFTSCEDAPSSSSLKRHKLEMEKEVMSQTTQKMAREYDSKIRNVHNILEEITSNNSNLETKLGEIANGVKSGASKSVERKINKIVSGHEILERKVVETARKADSVMEKIASNNAELHRKVEDIAQSVRERGGESSRGGAPMQELDSRREEIRRKVGEIARGGRKMNGMSSATSPPSLCRAMKPLETSDPGLQRLGVKAKACSSSSSSGGEERITRGKRIQPVSGTWASNMKSIVMM